MNSAEQSALTSTQKKSLSISLVTYKSNAELLSRTLTSLQAAIEALEKKAAWQCTLTLVDNGNSRRALQELLSTLQLSVPTKVLSNDKNLGFGAAHNRAIRGSNAQFHLILNPDVEMAETALSVALQHLQDHPEVVALSPQCRNERGETEYLCKRYPSVFDLFLRGFAPIWLRERYTARLACYACHDVVDAQQCQSVPLLSGCWMLCRSKTLQQVGGFDERYFLYFEDFALSLELGKLGALHYFPASSIIHHGGYAARKGLRHIVYFLRSAGRFFQHYGWKLW